jgi:hypothetical protein
MHNKQPVQSCGIKNIKVPLIVKGEADIKGINFQNGDTAVLINSISEIDITDCVFGGYKQGILVLKGKVKAKSNNFTDNDICIIVKRHCRDKTE